LVEAFVVFWREADVKVWKALGVLPFLAMSFAMFSGPATAAPTDPPEADPLESNVLWECACAAKCPGKEVVIAEQVCDTPHDIKVGVRRATEQCVEHAVAKCGKVACACECKTKGTRC
jgi:hypothetical protein